VAYRQYADFQLIGSA